ncbi:hypothetical protein D1632_07575 [Chryseobacterium nematophagum]|uniref:Uncharacterized protein n=1 Tax=Chryseobacterium nematophagum TaxID=2305228 RepID=A0A3M7LA94_9FLAO|nr:hypothetical protein [Chryseobacterium nematophagum]RMZ59487.1 hypothetical protein D1632_07575 [Chryseobacterium nematophagum]
MDYRKIIEILKEEHFKEVKNEGDWLEEGTVIFAKEIKKDIFLLFIILHDTPIDTMRALIAHFDSFNCIGKKEPLQLMFYLSIKDEEDFHYFKKYTTHQ